MNETKDKDLPLKDALALLARVLLAQQEQQAQLAAGMLAQQEQQAQLTAALAGVVGDREHFLKAEREERANQERIRAECEKSPQQRAQEAADGRWPSGPGRYRVALMDSKVLPDPADPMRRRRQQIPDVAFPVIDVNAASEEEARERYKVVNGILSQGERQIVARPLAGSPGAARPAPELEWEARERRHEAAVESLASQGVTPI